MTGKEFAAVRKRLGLGVVEFGRAIGYQGSHDNVSLSVRRFERGERPVPVWIERLVTLYERHGIPPEWLEGNDDHHG